MSGWGTITLDTRALDALIAAAADRADAALDSAAQTGAQIVRASFGTSPAGRTYRRDKRLYVASQPGFPPDVETGRLLRAITVERPGALQRTISTGDVPYAAALEFGGQRMAARPFMQPMMLTLADLLPNFFAELAGGSGTAS